ncbi:competence protein ComK [Alkalicoccobacillus plakortidis]|uniref:Competence protein ComK n=1 Tax=Alkalicoccobacillus plakortidis TaxID=444060 RepID=A0ABT0XJI7_9BACI|nr:competence protein ComK [Alkalicoccobacillus plakortidis]MCM2675930.1 competence protein ComK [Alkalicoccobacillus plakortidis]
MLKDMQQSIRHVDDYAINEQTLFIQPYRDIEYSTKVMEPNTTYLVKQTPLQLVQSACLANGSSYDGRRLYSLYSLGIKSKPPIMISEGLAIIAAPTLSPSNPNCEWFFSRHVVSCIAEKQEGKVGTQIMFRDRTSIFLDISHSQFLNALDKAHRCQAFLQNFDY